MSGAAQSSALPVYTTNHFCPFHSLILRVSVGRALRKMRRVRSDGTFLAALLPPQQVVFSQDPPVSAGLCSLEQISGSQEVQHVQSQLQHTHTHTRVSTHTQTETVPHTHTHTLASLGSREMKSLWNCGSITCITCFTCAVSQRSISWSRASSRSAPLQVCRDQRRSASVSSCRLCVSEQQQQPLSSSLIQSAQNKLTGLASS